MIEKCGLHINVINLEGKNNPSSIFLPHNEEVSDPKKAFEVQALTTSGVVVATTSGVVVEAPTATAGVVVDTLAVAALAVAALQVAIEAVVVEASAV